MPIAAPVEDVVSIELPDEEYPCDRRGCSRSAIWWFECPRCGSPTYRCEPCRSRTDLWIAREAGPTRPLRCKPCDSEIAHPLTWHRI